MKNKRVYFRLLTITLIVSAFSIGSANAQSDSLKTPESRAASLTDKMKTNLSLTDAQYPQVQALNLKYAQKNDSLFKSPGDRASKFQAMKTTNSAKDDEMKAILTPDQFTKYQAMQQEMREKMRQRYQNSNQ
jgi:hypothetical protein